MHSCFLCGRGKKTAPKPLAPYACDDQTYTLCGECVRGGFAFTVDEQIRAKLARLAEERRA